jgi:hypothetical protein
MCCQVCKSGWQATQRRIQPGDLDKRREEFNQDRINRFKGLPPTLRPMVTDPNHKGIASHPSEDSWNFFTGRSSMAEDK